VTSPAPSADRVLAAARAAASKKAEDILILDVAALIGITDHFLICTGNTERQVRTIAEEVQSKLREEGIKPYRTEGEREGRWVLLDYLDFVVHVFHAEEREFYQIERLWQDAPVVVFDEGEVATGGA
jgi:ribosome-associated protein